MAIIIKFNREHSQYNRFNWEEPEGGNAWSNLMHKNSKEIGIGGALTKECDEIQ